MNFFVICDILRHNFTIHNVGLIIEFDAQKALMFTLAICQCTDDVWNLDFFAYNQIQPIEEYLPDLFVFIYVHFG